MCIGGNFLSYLSTKKIEMALSIEENSPTVIKNRILLLKKIELILEDKKIEIRKQQVLTRTCLLFYVCVIVYMIVVISSYAYVCV
jgi:hypothetical protein